MYSLKSRSAIAFVCRDLCAESLNHLEPVNPLIFIRLYIESMRTLNKMGKLGTPASQPKYAVTCL